MMIRIITCTSILLFINSILCQLNYTDILVDNQNELSAEELSIFFVEEIRILLKQMCDHYGSHSSYENAQTAMKHMRNRLDGVSKFLELPAKIDFGKHKLKSRQYYEVIQGYCKKPNEIKSCIEQFLVDIDSCLPYDKISNKNAVQNITASLIDFTCNRNSSFWETSPFVLSEGLQCISSKKSGIEHCRKTVIEKLKPLEYDSDLMNNNIISLSETDEIILDNFTNEQKRSLNFQLRQCWIGDQLQQCIVNELLKCPNIVPANTVVHFFDLIRKSTPCNKHSRTRRQLSYNNDVGSKQNLTDTLSKTTKNRDNELSLFDDWENILQQKNISEEDIGLSINESTIPQVKEGEHILRQMCNRSGLVGNFETANTALNNIQNCFGGIIDFSRLPSEIKAARPRGSLDEVFQGYCRRVHEMKSCINKFLIEVEPCLAGDEKMSKYTAQNISEAVLQFACENDGDYIALFISEKGPQCILEKQPGIEQCIKQGINEKTSYEFYSEMIKKSLTISNTSGSTVSNEKELNVSYEIYQCRDAYGIQNCIINELKKCNGSTPANVVESIFNLVRKSTACSKYSRAQIDPNYNRGRAILTSIISLIIPALTILVSRSLSLSR